MAALVSMKTAWLKLLHYQPVRMIQTTTWSRGCCAMMEWSLWGPMQSNWKTELMLEAFKAW